MPNLILHNRDLCDGCGICVETCPQIVYISAGKHAIPDIARAERCFGCMACEEDCPRQALKIHRLPDTMPASAIPEPAKGLDDRKIYDLVIVGAGPAGIAAALRARQLGMTVAILERLPSPERVHHPDGGLLFSSKQVYELKPRGNDLYLEDLDLTISAEVIQERLQDFFMSGPNGQRTRKSTAAWAGFPLVDKSAMMNHFAQSAIERGAIIAYNTRAQKISKPDSNGLRQVIIDGGVSIRGRVVISAEGISGRLANEAGIPVNEKKVGWSISPYANLPPLPHPTREAGFMITEGSGVAAGPTLPYLGYASSGPHATHAAFGPIQTRKTRATDQPATDILRNFISTNSHLRSLWNGQPVSTDMTVDGCRVFVRRLPSRLSAESLLAVGDSITTCGMITTMLAMKTGDLAAQAAWRAIRKGDTSAIELASYDKSVRKNPMYGGMEWMNNLLIQAPLELGQKDLNRLFDKMSALPLGQVQAGKIWPMISFFIGLIPALVTDSKLRPYLKP
jgi:flavin-dependent dehydrogenase/NAD-dependent dihydropyrimidine dehydrogenase PreA subunit